MSAIGEDIRTAQVTVPCGAVNLMADLTIPQSAHGMVVFAHGSGSGRKSPRNRAVAEDLHRARFATLLLDLLTPKEDEVDRATRELRFDIARLATRLVAASAWLGGDSRTRRLPLGYYGASTGAAAALVAAAEIGEGVHAVVSRGGRPDLAGHHLREVRAATLLIVGGFDEPVLDMNRDAQRELRCVTHLEIVPHAGHLFEEPGAMMQVMALTRAWFERHLAGRPAQLLPRDGGW